MLNKKAITGIVAGVLSSISFSTSASEIVKTQVIVAPSCLIKEAKIQYQTLSTIDQVSLIKINETGLDKLIAAKANHKRLCGGFINVTDAYYNQNITLSSSKSFLSHYVKTPKVYEKKSSALYSVNYSEQVNQLLSQLNPDEMWSSLTKLTDFNDRHPNTATGMAAAKWIKNQVDQMAKDNNRKDITAIFVKTGNYYKQPSVVVKLGDSNEPGVVIGAHIDTLKDNIWGGRMPGADDDGSGSVTVLEVARTLISSGMTFKRPIYLIWYSAEEQGLVGSQYVVADFKKKNIPVESVIHFDMTGYAHKGEDTMWLITDNTNKQLTSYLETLINTYVKKPVKYTQCGYACSDHATWTQNGFISAFPFEASFENDNPDIHSSNDKMENLSLSHMTDYAKLGLAFVVEMAHPV